MKLSKKLEKNIIKEALRIKAIYETPNVEVDNIIAELKEAVNNHPIQSIEEMLDKNEAEAREILKNF